MAFMAYIVFMAYRAFIAYTAYWAYRANIADMAYKSRSPKILSLCVSMFHLLKENSGVPKL